MVKIKFEYFSERGPHACNEDYVAYDAEKSIFVICDGMGSHEHGEVASKVVAETIVQTWNPDVISVCKQASVTLDSCAYRMGLKEMGTTMALVSIRDNQATFAHCGDSRIYHIRDGKIIYQSVDHVALTDIGNPIINLTYDRRRRY